jgi:periplasmic copper chaperone A
MRLWIFLAVFFPLLVFAHSHEKGDVQVRHPWSRATPPGAKLAVGYMEIRNRGAKLDRVIGASTPLARKVEMHVTTHEDGVARMREVKAFEVPAGQRVEMRPGGSHLMLVDIVRPLAKGERIPLVLRFEHAGELAVELDVQELGSRHPRH